MKLKLLGCILGLMPIGMFAQTFVGTFDTLTVPSSGVFNGASSPSQLTSFEDGQVSYSCFYDSTFGGFWTKGFAYTNIVDTIDPSYTNLYGSAAGKGFNGTQNYVVANDQSVMKLKNHGSQFVKKLMGFRVTNTFYAYSSMRFGDSFDTPFGGSAGTQADYFKLCIKGYLDGNVKADSIEYYLADFRSDSSNLDYVQKSWEYVNCSNLGEVDSVKFILRSSRYNGFGYTTPLYFALDEVEVQYIDISSVEEHTSQSFQLYPNPARDILQVSGKAFSKAVIIDMLGNEVMHVSAGANQISHLPSGVYQVLIQTATGLRRISFIKE
jgi:hypothetical protein